MSSFTTPSYTASADDIKVAGILTSQDFIYKLNKELAEVSTSLEVIPSHTNTMEEFEDPAFLKTCLTIKLNDGDDLEDFVEGYEGWGLDEEINLVLFDHGLMLQAEMFGYEAENNEDNTERFYYITLFDKNAIKHKYVDGCIIMKTLEVFETGVKPQSNWW